MRLNLRLISHLARVVVLAGTCGLGATALLAASPDANEHWPQWRGPMGTGASTTAQPPVEWSAEKNIKWKVKLPGSGSAVPIVWGDKVFIQTAIPTGKKIEPPAETKAAPPAADAAPPTTPPAAEPRSGEDRPKADRPAGGPGGDQPGGNRAGGGRRGGGRGFGGQKPTEFHQFALLCLDRQTGQELWRKVVREEVPHEGHHPDHGFASHSPVTDGTCVIAYFGSRGLHCFDMEGNKRWEKDLGKMQTIFTFGEGSSPALYDNTVVVNWDHEGEDFIAAFNKLTGDELWRTPRDEKTSWATPLIVPFEGQNQVIVPAVSKIRAYDLANGQLIWECSGLKPNAIPSPVATDGIVYLMTGFQGSALLAIRLGRTGDLTDSDAIVWKLDKDTPYVPSPVLYDSKLFFFKSNNAVVSCFDAKTGSPMFGPERLEGISNVYASPVAAAGRVYLVGRNGTTLVIRAGDKFEVLATNKLDEGIDASPALVGKEIFLRGKENLYCIAEK